MTWRGGIVFVLVLLLGLGLITSEVIGGPPDPDGWIYGETSVSGLSVEEKTRLLGVLEGGQPPKAVRLYANYSYPSSLDWRDRYGGDFTTPIKDQGQCGSCVAFAVVASIESRLKVRLINPNLNPDLSEAHPFFCGCAFHWYGESYPCCWYGWWRGRSWCYYAIARGIRC